MFSIPMSVARSVSVNKTSTELFETIANFSTWPRWSPWLCMEPDCSFSVTGEPGQNGHRQEWSGKIIGAGTMEVTGATPDEYLAYDLQFLKPWKSQARVVFRLFPRGDETEVTWTMESTLPFFLFFMLKSMTAWLSNDFDRGLSMLKEFAESGEVLSAVNLGEVEHRHEMFYVGIHRSCSMREVGPAMHRDLARMNEFLTAHRLPSPESVFTLYHRFDPVKQVAEYTSGFVYSEAVESIPKDAVTGRLPEHKALRVNHTGAARHLGNAWAAAMGCARAGHKVNKSVAMYEVYTSDPSEVPERDLQTDIFLPVR